MRFRKFFAVAACASLLVAGSVSSANASSVPGVITVTDDEVNQLKAWMTRYDVPADTQSDLIESFKAGEAWDSISDGPAVSVEERQEPGQITNITRYEDGSVGVTSVEDPTSPTSQITPFAVNGCTIVNDGLMRRKTNCTVVGSAGVIEAKFKADYNQQFSAQDLAYATYGSIQAVRNAEVAIIGGTYSIRSFGRTQTVATAGSPAKARLTIDFQCVGGWCGVTGWLQLNVPMNTYTLGYSTQQL